jgi:hypothetical protein
VFRCSRFAEARGALLGAGAALVAALVALSGCGVLASTGSGAAPGPDATSAAPRTYTVTSAVTTVIVNGGAGTITVTGSERATVEVTERAYYSNSKEPPATSHAVAGGTLTLSYSCPTQLTCGVGYALAVPRGTTVRVSDREGAITLTSLSGPVTAQTIAGAINASGLASPTASLSSRAGSITAAFTAAPASASASTNAGPITLTLPPAVAYKVSAHTYVGNSTVTVRQSASSPHVISASSDLGSITISPS